MPRPAYQELEFQFAQWMQLPYEGMVACSSGTAALHLALEALELPQGSAVIVPDFTMVACARACTLAGLVPVFADCGHDLCLDPVSVDKLCHAERDRVKAIMAVHVYGRSCDMGALHTIATEYGLAVIEDLAECHGLVPHAMTHAACWSFYANKVIHGEEGGAVYFKEQARAMLAASLRCQGFTEAHDFFHTPRGCNYRLANCLAEKVLQGLNSFGQCMTDRRRVERWYDAACPDDWKMPPRLSPWVYDFRLPTGTVLDKVIKALQERGHEARHGFKPMSVQPEYARGRVPEPARFNYRAAQASQRVGYLPLAPYGSYSQYRCSEAFDIVRRVVGEH